MNPTPSPLEPYTFLVEPLESRRMLAGADADTYQPDADPTVGFNLVSFFRERGRAAQSSWVDGVQSMHDAGANDVTFAVYREVNHRNGLIKRGTGPGYHVIKAAAEHAQGLGMTVTINPLFEVTGDDGGWRGDWNPTGKEAIRFQRSYKRFVKDLANIAESRDVARLNIGSELVAFVNNADNAQFLTDLITDTDGRFSGEIGYVANWSNFDSPQLASNIWNHEAIDYLGVSAYFSNNFGNGHVIVDVETADDPNADLVAAAEAGWNDIFDSYLIPTAEGIRGGELPIIIQEFGLVPFNLAGANPWSTTPSETATGVPGETPDPQEQHDVFRGLLRALDGRADEIAGVDFWTWSFESNQDDMFALDPSEGSSSELAATMIVDFLNSDATLARSANE